MIAYKQMSHQLDEHLANPVVPVKSPWLPEEANGII